MQNNKRTKIGIIGCGSISSAYCKGANLFKNLELKACADIMPERAKKLAEEFKIPKAYSVEDLLKVDHPKGTLRCHNGYSRSRQTRLSGKAFCSHYKRRNRDAEKS